MKTSKSGARPALLLLAVSISMPRAYPQTPPQISLQLSNGATRLSISGDVGSVCTIQSVTNLSRNWEFMTNFTLLGSQSLVFDPTGPIAAQRFYRVYSQRVPTNVVPANMVWISAGTFTMGSPPSEAQRDSGETQHTVTISHGFCMGKYLVTQGEYASVMGTNPSCFTTNDCAWGRQISPDLSRPVETVSWYDAVAYCAALTTGERNAGRLPAGYVYRLPTEGEWEYACRAGTTTAFHYGPALRSGMANFDGRFEYDASRGLIYNPSGTWLGGTTSVGSYAPNAWGLYDMHGNVWEWCRDLYGEYPAGSLIDPQGPAAGSYRVIRGGSWSTYARYSRSAIHTYGTYYPAYRSPYVGFRVVLAPGQP